MKLNTLIYRNGKTDCTNSGLSSRMENAECHFFSDSEAEGYSPEGAQRIALEIPKENQNKEFVIVEDICCGARRLRAIPANLLLTNKWTMFGGNYLATSDSRFFENPVQIHDRVE